MKKILIIEDDPIIAELYRGKLVKAGFEVEVETNGISGLEKIHAFRPDLLVLDLVMPRMDGVEVIRHVRANRDYKGLPIVVLSSANIPSVVQEAWKAGANRCLGKGECTPKDLIELINKLLAGGVTDLALPEKLGPVSGMFLPLPPMTKAKAEILEEVGSREAFAAESHKNNRAIRAALASLAEGIDKSAQADALGDLAFAATWLPGNAAQVGCPRLAQVAGAFEALVKALFESPGEVNASSLRTLKACVNFLGRLIDKTDLIENLDCAPPQIVVMDNVPNAARLVMSALERAGLKATPWDEQEEFLKYLEGNRVDLIVLDTDVRGISPLVMCERIRGLPMHAVTPVFLVAPITGFAEWLDRASVFRYEVIGKPFLFMELAVKSLTYILASR